MATMLGRKKTHIILFYQAGKKNLDTRSFSEFESVTECVEGIISMFEDFFKMLHPTLEVISYDLNAVLRFVDALQDLSCLVYNPVANMYAPYNKAWIKEKIFNHMRRNEQENISD